jgi:hypothetical protein
MVDAFGVQVIHPLPRLVIRVFDRSDIVAYFERCPLAQSTQLSFETRGGLLRPAGRLQCFRG